MAMASPFTFAVSLEAGGGMRKQCVKRKKQRRGYIEKSYEGSFGTLQF